MNFLQLEYRGRILSQDETEDKDQSYFKVIGVDKHNGIIDGKYSFGNALGRYIAKMGVVFEMMVGGRGSKNLPFSTQNNACRRSNTFPQSQFKLALDIL